MMAYIQYITIFLVLINLTYIEASGWQLQGSKICYGTRGFQYGSLKLNREGFLVGLKLEHISGYLTCNRKHPQLKSNWGCKANKFPAMGVTNEHLGTMITDDKNDIIFPNMEGMLYFGRPYYKLPGFKGDSDLLVYSSFCNPMYARKGQLIRIWFGEDLYKANPEFLASDNGGYHCVNVYAKFL